MCGVCECIPFRPAKNTENGKFACIRREIHHRHQAPAALTDDNKYALFALCVWCWMCSILANQGNSAIDRSHRKNHVRRVKETMSAVI